MPLQSQYMQQIDDSLIDDTLLAATIFRQTTIYVSG